MRQGVGAEGELGLGGQIELKKGSINPRRNEARALEGVTKKNTETAGRPLFRLVSKCDRGLDRSRHQ